MTMECVYFFMAYNVVQRIVVAAMATSASQHFVVSNQMSVICTVCIQYRLLGGHSFTPSFCSVDGILF